MWNKIKLAAQIFIGIREKERNDPKANALALAFQYLS
jgi:hypothetical protein